MPASRIRKTGDQAVDFNFGELDTRINRLEDADLSAARLVGPVSLVTGNNLIRHGLRRARGRIVVRISAAVTLYDVDNADPTYWVVNSSGAATAYFLFF
jgi:hypothetical protein